MRTGRLALLAGAASLLATTGCDRPLPTITVQAGPGSMQVAPAAWCFSSKQSDCRPGITSVPTLKVPIGARIGIDVPSEVRDGAWYATIGSDKTATFHHQYHVFLGQLSLGASTITVQLHAESNDGGNGLFEFHLQPVVR